MKLGLRPQAESNSHHPTISSGLQKSYWKRVTRRLINEDCLRVGLVSYKQTLQQFLSLYLALL
jgi:hypothetical protein